MRTVIIYWNATRFTRYEHIDLNDICVRENYIQLVLAPGRILLVPFTTINRIEIVVE